MQRNIPMNPVENKEVKEEEREEDSDEGKKKNHQKLWMEKLTEKLSNGRKKEIDKNMSENKGNSYIPFYLYAFNEELIKLASREVQQRTPKEIIHTVYF